MGKERPNNALKTSHWLLILYHNDKVQQYLKTSLVGLFHPLLFIYLLRKHINGLLE